MTHEKQEQILTYWFGDDSLKPFANQSLWFSKSPKTDAEIKQRFERLVEHAADGAFDDWVKTPRGALALVILCDQFTRHIYRGDEQAFACDHRALKAAQIAIDHGFDKKLTLVERWFLYMPFEHSENIDIQRRSVELFKTLAEEAQADERRFVLEALDFAEKHYQVINKFGRFPHRNDILGRESTREEQQFLRQPGSYF